MSKISTSNPPEASILLAIERTFRLWITSTVIPLLLWASYFHIETTVPSSCLLSRFHLTWTSSPIGAPGSIEIVEKARPDNPRHVSHRATFPPHTDLLELYPQTPARCTDRTRLRGNARWEDGRMLSGRLWGLTLPHTVIAGEAASPALER